MDGQRQNNIPLPISSAGDNKSSRHHNLLESVDIANDVLLLKNIKNMMRCPDHSETMVTFKCEDHGRYICVNCITQCHRKCIDIIEITKVNTHENEGMNASVKEALSQLKEITVSSKIKSENNLARIRSQLVVIQSEQQSLFGELSERLSQAKCNLESEIDVLVTEELQKSERTLRKCKEAEAAEKEYTKILGFILKFGNSKELNIIPNLILEKAKLIREAVETECTTDEISLKLERTIGLETMSNIAKISIVPEGHEKQLQLQSNLCTSSDEILAPDNKILALRKSNIDSPKRCSVSTQTDEVQPESDKFNICMDTSKSDTKNLHKSSAYTSLMTQNINHQGIAYKVKCPGDRHPCTICAIENLCDERIALIDYSNKKLKVFEEDFSPVYTNSFSYRPRDLCHVQDTKFAITFENCKWIEIYDIGKKHAHRKNAFQTKYDIVAIEKFGNDGNIAVLFEENDNKLEDRFSVQIRNAKTGSIDQDFCFDKFPDVPFRFEYSGVKRILCNETNEIFVSDGWKFHCFDTLDAENDSIPESWFYKSRTGNFIQGISDLSLDNEGNIYACGNDSCNVHQISNDDFRVNRIIVSNIEKPISVLVNSNKGFLVIGCDSDDFIHVYHFL